MPYVRPKPAGAATSSANAVSAATATNGTGSSSGSSSDAAIFSPSTCAATTTTSSGLGLGSSWDAASVERQLRELGVAEEAVLVDDAPSPLSPPPISPRTASNGSNRSSSSSSMVVQAIGRGNAGSPAAAPAAPPAMSSRRAMKQALFQLSDAEDEGEGRGGNDGEMQAAVQSQQQQHDTGDYLAKLRAARGDPMRRSISAMSGVTVIGRGAPSMHREGSSSTLGSQRGSGGGRSSLDEQRHRAGRGSIDEEGAAEVFAKPPSASSSPPPPPPPAAGPSSSAAEGEEVGQNSNHLDLSTALNLLSSYPRSTSPARNRVIDEPGPDQPPSYGAGVGEADPRASGAGKDVPPPFTRSASAGEVPATTTKHQPPLVPYHSSGASSPSSSHHNHHPRRHSRSSIHERDRVSPGFALSPIHGAAELPPHSHQQQPSSTTSPILSREPSLASSYQFPGPHRSEGLAGLPETSRGGNYTPPGSSSALFSNTYSLQSSAPPSTTSPRIPHRPETAGGRLSRSTNRSRRGSAKSPEFYDPAYGPPPPTASSSRRPSSARSSSTSDLSQIMRSFSGKPRRSGTLSRQHTHDNLTAVLAEEVGVDEADLAASLRRSSSQKSAGGSGSGGVAGVSVAELKHLIQQKRRQASAPFHSLASVSIPPSQSGSPVLPRSGAHSPVLALQPGQFENGLGSAPVRQPWEGTPPRRARSRHATMGGVNGSLTLSLSTNGFEEARLRAMRGMGEVVMTPSIEEWRQLGLNESLNDRDSGSSSGSETDEENSTGSTSEEDTALSETEGDAYDMAGRNDSTPRPRVGSISRIGRHNGSAPPPHPQDFASQLCSLSEEERQAEARDEHATPLKRSSHSGITRVASKDGSRSAATSLAKSPKLRHGDGRERERRRDRDSAGDHSGDISTTSETDESLDLDLEMERRMSQRSSGSIPTLSRQSLSATTGTPTPGNGHGGSGTPLPSQAGPFLQSADAATMRLANGVSVSAAPSPLPPSSPAAAPSNASSPLIPPPSPSRASSPLPLTAVGPIDPRAYSAVTGMRTVDSFVVQGEAGKGAYGLVRRVREKGPDGKAVGPDMMLKYIVKQRILADAYKRHKVLGAIPMEIHVLDFVRRVQRLGAHPASPRDPLSAVAAFKASLGLSPSPGSSPLPHTPPTTTASANVQQQYAYGHPSLCQMLDFFEDAENYYLVMACFGEGQDLFDYVDAAPNGLELGESRTILRQIVDAVAFLHSHGIVHRDIKDENIILDGQGGVQLIDFGSAAYVREGKPYFDTFSGTLDFASPEVLRGERYGGKETDIWALGVLGYVILCGECPFWSSEESLSGLEPGTRAEEALQRRVMEAEADLPPETSSDQFASHARNAVDLIHQCLAVHSRDRPSAVQLQDHRFLRDDGRGWTGHRGWELRLSDSASGSGSDSESA